MNTPEKISLLYVRLNGFLLLPHFTLFNGDSHSHVDFVGIRPANGKEICNSLELPVDDELYKAIDSVLGNGSLRQTFGVVGEVKGGKGAEIPEEKNLKYVQNFLGGLEILGLSFAWGAGAPKSEKRTVLVGIEHSIDWIKSRVSWMDSNLSRLSKSGSWNWSDEYMGDVLYLIKIGKFN